MKEFLYHIPTKIHFGSGTINHLPEEIKSLGNRVLLVYGGGSIRRSGLYERISRLLRDGGIEFFDLSGVHPNPRISSVRAGVRLCREKNIDVILPVGGGSVLDCGKAIAAAVHYEGDAWDLVSGKASVGRVLPVITVITMAATGSEMDTSAVISNPETKEKLGFSNAAMRPVVSILDPELTYSVSKYQTAAGTADIMSHVLEVYFNHNPDACLQNRFCEAILKTVIKYGKKALDKPDDYEARANLLWSGSWAINGLLSKGNPVGWSVHAMEHELSAYYDITHGVGLAILIPHWLRHMMRDENRYKYLEYGQEVWGIKGDDDENVMAEQAIAATADYFREMKLPASLREIGISDEYFHIMSERAEEQLSNTFIPMTKEDVLTIYYATL